jgi:energy-coupling factor transport system ATP-binding protein
MPILEVRDLFFAYPNGVQALNGVSLVIEPGETVAIVGRNGSGKTTLVKHFNSLLTAEQGSIWVNGQSVFGREPAELAASLGIVFQNPADQIFQSKVQDEVGFGPLRLGATGPALLSRIKVALDIVGLGWAAELHPYDLTLTDRKLICLASILAMEPALIVLDEPTTAQDQLGIARLVEIVRLLHHQGRTLVTITHDMDFVAEAFERVIVMRDGQVILDGPTASVFQQPQVLETTYVKPPELTRLSQRLGLSEPFLSIPQTADWVQVQVEKASATLNRRS